MGEFRKRNPDLHATMDTHLIDLDEFGVWENDYDRFRRKRSEAISRELEKRIIRRDIDEQGQEVQTDDFEDAELEEMQI
jgi:hypothetical protein